jgi:hypothetical protein
MGTSCGDGDRRASGAEAQKALDDELQHWQLPVSKPIEDLARSPPSDHCE